MEFVFEILFQFVGELLLQLLFEALSEVGLHGVKDTLRKPRNRVLSTIGFAVWGGLPVRSACSFSRNRRFAIPICAS